MGTKVAVAVGPGSGSLAWAAPPTSEKETSTDPKLTRRLSGITSPNATRCGAPRYRSTLAAMAAMPEGSPLDPVGDGESSEEHAAASMPRASSHVRIRGRGTRTIFPRDRRSVRPCGQPRPSGPPPSPPETEPSLRCSNTGNTSNGVIERSGSSPICAIISGSA